jgi:uncharacterized protein
LGSFLLAIAIVLVGCDKLKSIFHNSAVKNNSTVKTKGSSLPSAGLHVRSHNSETGHGGARLAIILDDLGSDRAAAEAIFSLDYPLTISVLPFHANSAEIATEAHQRGYEVMLHLPMQSVGKEAAEAQELRPGMMAAEISRDLNEMLSSVPEVVGVNNHQGSQATADARLMGELMPLLRERHLFYVDSRTTAATVAFEAAEHAGVRSGYRNVPFLDDVQDVGAIRRQLELAFREAKVKGNAIAIGHPHAETLQALKEELPKAVGMGIELVLASEVVK